MGYTPEEREEESQQMMQAVTSCFANRLCMTTKAKEDLLEKIGSEKKYIADLEGELGEENCSLDVPMDQVHACHSETGMSLKQVHGRLVERTLALEVLRMERQVQFQPSIQGLLIFLTSVHMHTCDSLLGTGSA